MILIAQVVMLAGSALPTGLPRAILFISIANVLDSATVNSGFVIRRMSSEGFVPSGGRAGRRSSSEIDSSSNGAERTERRSQTHSHNRIYALVSHPGRSRSDSFGAQKDQWATSAGFEQDLRRDSPSRLHAWALRFPDLGYRVVS